MSFTLIQNCKAKDKVTNPNMDKELSIQTQISENKNLDISLYLFDNIDENNETIDTILKELADKLNQINATEYKITGETNIKQSIRRAYNQSKAQATWISHKLKDLGVKANLINEGITKEQYDRLVSSDENKCKLENKVTISIK